MCIIKRLLLLPYHWFGYQEPFPHPDDSVSGLLKDNFVKDVATCY